MFRVSMFALIGGLLVASGGLVGQDPKKDEPKAAKTKDEPGAPVKGVLPQYWGKLGLTDDQKQEVYKVQAKYNAEIDKLEAKIKELKAARDREMKGVLTADQRKALQDIYSKKGN
jgi:Spy/CpxP family protein refolding chaperone